MAVLKWWRYQALQFPLMELCLIQGVFLYLLAIQNPFYRFSTNKYFSNNNK